MKRHRRQLDGKRDKKAQHQPEGDTGFKGGIEQFEVVETIDAAIVLAYQHLSDDRGQHHQTAHLGEKEKLYCRVDAVLMPPDTDQKIHRDNHQFPAEKEQEQVYRQKDADGTGQTGQ